MRWTDRMVEEKIVDSGEKMEKKISSWEIQMRNISIITYFQFPYLQVKVKNSSKKIQNPKYSSIPSFIAELR